MKPETLLELVERLDCNEDSSGCNCVFYEVWPRLRDALREETQFLRVLAGFGQQVRQLSAKEICERTRGLLARLDNSEVQDVGPSRQLARLDNSEVQDVG
jgi:hypothetical protein